MDESSPVLKMFMVLADFLYSTTNKQTDNVTDHTQACIDRVPSFYYWLKTSNSQSLTNMATFHYSEKACPHFSNGLLLLAECDPFTICVHISCLLFE